MNAYSLRSRLTDARRSFWQVLATSIGLVTVCTVASAQQTAHPTPKFAYVANDADFTVSAYRINSATGALRKIAGSPFATGPEPSSIVVDPSGQFAYLANFGDNTVSAYTIDSVTGALRKIAGSPFATGNSPTAVTVDPSGKFAYVANFYGNSISAYTINRSTGELHAIAGSPFGAGTEPVSVTVDPSGQFAYVANTCQSNNDCNSGNVLAYAINGSTGALSAISDSLFSAGFDPSSVAVDPSGQFAYVANKCRSINDCASGNVTAFTINSATGALSAVAGSPFAAGYNPRSVTVDPSGQCAYVTNYLDNNVSAYTIDSATGALRKIAGSPFATGKRPNAVTIDPSGRFAYVPNFGDSTVSAYTINRATGALNVLAGSPFTTEIGPDSVAIASQAQTTPVLTLTPRSLAFGNLPIHTSSAAQSVTVTNTSANAVAITGIALRGSNPGQFSFTDDCGKSLAAYRTCTIDAKFTPTTKGAKTAFLDVNGGGGGLRSVKLTGTGT